MPQFEMPLEDHAQIHDFNRLDAFVQGYVEAMFFTECHADNPELEHASFGDLAPSTLAAIKDDCAAFLTEDIRAILDNEPCDDEQAGRDFWFTRNGHGVGFWDRGDDNYSKAARDTLTEWAHTFGPWDLYMGDDGKLYG
jgi:hypothetical protein